ncbi:hypothetical protein [Paenibacillus gansuensis]|uniref:Uncharacterized protein n=1 Tax=Paenibacillus gansuensis TaxID=306542 RepID=A0ABW5PIR1_9BACL
MYPIYPITKDAVLPFSGQLVCAVLKDGTRHVGILSRVHNGKLILNETEENHRSTTVEKHPNGKKQANVSKKTRKAGLSSESASGEVSDSRLREGFGYPGPRAFFGPPLLLDVELILLLALLL